MSKENQPVQRSNWEASTAEELTGGSNAIQRTAHAQARLLHDMRVNLRCRHILMAEQILHGAEIVTVFQKMRGEGMPQRVARRIFVELDPQNRRLHRPLQIVLLQMMSPDRKSTRLNSSHLGIS